MYSDYPKYFEDQMVRFESFEGELYADGIKMTIHHLFEPKTALDVCCGDGTTTQCLLDKGFSVVGIDGNERKIDRAKHNVPQGEFYCLDINNIIGFDLGIDKFDLIYASHCFEHFLDPMLVLHNIKVLLKPGGSIILVLPYPNQESDGHPGSGRLKLDKSMDEIMAHFLDHGFDVSSMEKVNFREPELIICIKTE